MLDLEVLSGEVAGVHAHKAWRLLMRAGEQLMRRDARDIPKEYVLAVLAMHGWLARSIDPSGDALVHTALAVATQRGWPEQAALCLLLAARTANRGDLSAVGGLLRRAESIGPRSSALELLELHVAIRAGKPVDFHSLDEYALSPNAIELQRALALIAQEQFDEARSGLLALRADAGSKPMIFGAASFFLAEASMRAGRWEALLEFARDADAGLGFMGPQPYRWTLQSWRAHALRRLGRDAEARIHAWNAYEEGQRHGVTEVMIESSIELAELSRGAERRKWKMEVSALLPGTLRPEVRRRGTSFADGSAVCRGVQVHSSGRWMRVDDELVDFSTRHSLRRVLNALATHKGRSPLDVDSLFSMAWPGEEIGHRSRRARVHTAIWQLRRLGMRDLLLRLPEGYLLDVDIEVMD